MAFRTILAVGGRNRGDAYFPSANAIGLSIFDFDETTGSATLLCDCSTVDNPLFLTIDPERQVIYSASQMFGWPEGLISAHRLDLHSRCLTWINSQKTLGSLAAYASISPDRRHLLVANYLINGGEHNKAAIVLPLQENGGLAPAISSVEHHGAGSDAVRQDRAHPHCIVASPDGHFAVVADLGLDALIAYPFSSTGELDANRAIRSDLPPGCGPRHLIFHHGGDFAFVTCELSSKVLLLGYEATTGAFTQLAGRPTVPTGMPGKFASDIQLHPNGRFLYTADRGGDQIGVFTFRPKNRELDLIGYFSCGGATPRSIAIDPSGRFLLSANEDSDEIAIFAIEPSDGSLQGALGSIRTGTPAAIGFARLF